MSGNRDLWYGIHLSSEPNVIRQYLPYKMAVNTTPMNSNTRGGAPIAGGNGTVEVEWISSVLYVLLDRLMAGLLWYIYINTVSRTPKIPICLPAWLINSKFHWHQSINIFFFLKFYATNPSFRCKCPFVPWIGLPSIKCGMGETEIRFRLTVSYQYALLFTY